MKNLSVLISIILFLSLHVLAQQNKNTVRGFVFDKSDSEPLAGVNVYISNTLWGSSTDKDGRFIIESIPEGTHELVVSMMGYQVQTKMFRIKKNETKKMQFRLKPQVYETDAITVVAADKADWYIELNIFKDKFIGKTAFAKQCFIKNEPVLNFDWEKSIMRAKAKEPLIIINRALGYKIHSILIAFSWDKAKERLSWVAKNQYSELTPKDEAQKQTWQKNRDQTFDYSQVNFLNWLKSEDREDKYKLQYYQERPVHLLNPNQYYVIKADSLIHPGISDDEHEIIFKDYLKVIHKKSANASYLRLNHQVVTIDKFGYPQEILPFEVYGYWAMLGLADMLPMYYGQF